MVLVGTDTDLLIMLVACASTTSKLLMLHPSTSNRPQTIYPINSIQECLGPTKQNMLCLHAVTGCNTTSAPYRRGKKKAFKILKSDVMLAEEVNVFNQVSASSTDVITTGEKFILALYGGTNFSTLDSFRYFSYKRSIGKQSESSTFDLATLPPTSAAAKQHFLRTYLQVQEWLGNSLQPTNWGWQMKNELLVPFPTELDAATSKLLKMIRCGCRAGCMARCSCKRAGLPCSAMCTSCMGIGCSNSIRSDDSEIDDHVHA